MRYSLVKRNVTPFAGIKKGWKRIVVTFSLLVHTQITTYYRNVYVMYERKVECKEPEQLVFDGRIYNLWGTAPTKRLADAYADTRRNHGLLARVVKAKYEFSVIS